MLTFIEYFKQSCFLRFWGQCAAWRFVASIFLLFYMSLAQAQQSPVIITGEATAVNDLGATLNGTLNLNSVGYWHWYCEIGQTEALEMPSLTNTANFAVNGAETGANDVPLAVSTAKLLPNQKYFYRVVARRIIGGSEIIYGSMKSFTTSAPATPPKITPHLSSPALSFGHQLAEVRTVIRSGSSPAKVFVQYGLTSDYGLRVELADLVLTNEESLVQLTMRNLQPGTTYHYCWYATNAEGTVSSGNRTFTTHPAPLIETLEASDVTYYSAELRGRGNPLLGANLAPVFELGTTPDLGTEVLLSGIVHLPRNTTTDVSVRVANLAPSTKYYFRFLGKSEEPSDRTNGEIMSFTTGPAGAVPSLDSPPIASEIKGHSAMVRLDRMAAGDHVASAMVEYGATPEFGIRRIIPTKFEAGSSDNILADRLTDLVPSKTYYYRFLVSNASGFVYSPTATFTTPAPPTVKTLPATDIGDLSARVHAQIEANGNTCEVKIEWGTTSAYGNFRHVVFDPEKSLHDWLFHAPADTTIHYRIVVDDGKFVYVGENQSFKTLPLIPRGPSVQELQADIARFQFLDPRPFISWDNARIMVQYDAGTAPATVVIEYGTTENYGQVATTEGAWVLPFPLGTSMLLKNLTPATTYHCRAKVTSNLGTVYSPNFTFTTMQHPELLTLPAVNVSDQQAVLKATINPQGWHFHVSLEYGLTEECELTARSINLPLVDGWDGGRIRGIVENISAVTERLLPSTTYYYRLKGVTPLTDGERVLLSQVGTFRTLAPQDPPSLPNPITVSGITSGGARVTLTNARAGSSEATVMIEYGTTNALGQTVARSEKIPAFSSEDISVELSGLDPATLYHVRAKVTNGQGEALTEIVTFTTSPPGAKPTFQGVVNASFLQADQVLLQLSQMQSGDSITTVNLEYGTTEAYGNTVLISSNFRANQTFSPGTTLQGLTPGTTYHSRFILSNAHGVSYTPNFSFTTRPRPTTDTTAATAVTDLAMTLNASVNANLGTYNCSFDWGRSENFGQSILANPSSITGSATQAASARITGLLPATRYFYRIRVGNFAGPTMSVTTASPTTLPTINGFIIPFDIQSNSASLRVSQSISSGSSDASVVFEYGLTTAYGLEKALPAIIPVNSTLAMPTVQLTELGFNTTYQGRFKVTNAQGTTYSSNIEFSTSFGVLTQPAQEITDVSARLRASINTGGGLLSSIRFRWGNTAQMNSTIDVNPSSLSGLGTSLVNAPLTGLIPNTQYFFQVSAVDQVGVARIGPVLSFQTANAISPPQAPSAPEIQVLRTRSVDLITRNLQAGGAVTSVVLEYGTTLNFGSEISHWTTLGVGATSSVSISISGLSPATTYHARCRVRSTLGTSFSPTITFTTHPSAVLLAHPPSDVSDLGATLQGEARAPGEFLFNVAFVAAPGGATVPNIFAVNQTAGSTPDTFFYTINATGLQPNTTYSYRLSASSTTGGGAIFSEPQTFTTLPARTRPSMVGELRVGSVSSDRVLLNPPIIRAGSSNATVVYEYGTSTSYGTTTTPAIISLNQMSAESITLSGLTPSTTYYVRCVATNAQGSVTSNAITFTTNGTPVLTTQAPSEVADISAVFNGSVNPNGNTINARYVWGLSPDLLSPLSIMGPDIARFQNITGASPVSLPTPIVQNLRPQTTYYYRILASDDLNQWTGPLLSFTTSSAVTPPSLDGTLTIEEITMNTATVIFKNPLQGPAIFAGAAQPTVSIEYGLTTNYGTPVTQWIFIPTMSPGGELNVSMARITNLQSGTVYHVRLKVSSALGTVYSNNATFTTARDHLVTTNAPTQIGEFGATLSAQVTNGSQDSTSVSFDWGLSSSYGNTSSSGTISGAATGTITIPITNLSPNTTYHYRAKVRGYKNPTNDQTVWFYGENQTFRTPPATTPPQLTSTPEAGALRSTSAAITQSFQTGSSETTVTVEYGTTENYGSVANLATWPTPGDSLTRSVTLTGLQPGTRYFVRTKAVNAQDTVFSAPITLTTIPLPLLELAAADTITSNSATLNGRQTNPLSTGFTYRFEWGTSTNYGSVTSAFLQDQRVFASISGLVPATTYFYRLTAFDSGSTVVTSAGSFVSGPSPVAPVLGTQRTAYAITSTAATLWIDRVSAPATIIFDYGITPEYGSVAISPQSTSPDGVLRNVTVELSDLQPATTYFYRCRAINSIGTSLGAQGTFRTLPLPEITTQSPVQLGAKSMTLVGLMNARNASLTPTFELGTSPSFGTIADVPQGAISGSSTQEVTASLSGLLPETTYYLRLRARDARGAVFLGEPLQIRTLSLAQAWRLQHFNKTDPTGDGADLANPTGDGIPNLMKYALDLNPTLPTKLPEMSRIVPHSTGNRLGYVFTRDQEKRDLTYVVEVADTLAGPWTALASSVGGNQTSGPGFVRESNAGENKRTVEVLDTVNMTDAPRRFMRLRVVRATQP
jgi:phosphodiesterase/alkaline phosphatase D-like protein